MSDPARPSQGLDHPDPEGAPRFAAPADLDVPGETGRQARVFAIWFFCLLFATVLAANARPVIAERDRDGDNAEQNARSRSERLKIAGLVGLLLPALLTYSLTYYRRRGGGHARGIRVEVTAEGELRLWGRGYGSRLALPGALVEERLVDVYAGRLGAWRQRRIRIRMRKIASRGQVSEIELATVATAQDVAEGLRAEGGEGDCVEIERDDFDRLRLAILEASAT